MKKTGIIEQVDFSTDDKIAEFLINFINRTNIVYTYVRKYHGYPGGESEDFFNEGDVRGTMNYAIVNVIKFFNNDLSRERSAKTVVGAFMEIAHNELHDVYNKRYRTKRRTVAQDGKNVRPSITNEVEVASEAASASEELRKKELHSKFYEAVEDLATDEKKVITMKIQGYRDQEIADSLGVTKREVITILTRAKRHLASNSSLGALCAA